ncbi:ABC transporter ATP-binding protein, partial [Streptomyces sp. SID7982]|nr:ABC transporter ATP-binding protein [Streptomyces sp. SID7982]
MSGSRTAQDEGRDTDGTPGTGEEGAALRALLRPVRGRIVLGVVLQAVAGIASLGSFIAIHPLAVALLEDEPDESRVWWIV